MVEHSTDTRKVLGSTPSARTKMSNFKTQTIHTYDTISAEYNRANFNPFWVSEFEQYAKLVPGKKVVDIGCGAGREAVVFVKNGFDYTGVDASQAMLNIAKTRAQGGVFIQMDFYHLEFPDNTFDGFWAAASFLHVPKSDVSKLILEAKRVIKPGGVGFISIKEKDGTDEGVIQQNRFGTTIARYFAFYEKDEFKKYLTDVGLTVVSDAIYHENDERHTVWLGYFVQKPH